MIAGRSFREVFGIDSVLSARAPGRVNLMGDHTDYNDGFVLPAAIPQQTMVEAAPGNGMHEVYSATLDRMVRFDAGALTDFARYVGGCVRVLERRGVKVPALRLHIASDVPVGAGLSSSAALEVATLRALDGLLGLGLDPEEVAHLAHRAEVEFAGVSCGIMDQMACSLGRMDRMLFLDTMTLERSLLPLPAGSELLVMHSGVPRSLAGSDYNRRRDECKAAATMLGVQSLRMVDDLGAVDRLPSPLRERARHVITENRRVLAARKTTAQAVGEVITHSHASVRDEIAVSLPAMDALVAALNQEF